ncbi:MAG: hypothetical protein ACE5HQ_08465 [Gemmatimonadota bacterium]
MNKRSLLAMAVTALGVTLISTLAVGCGFGSTAPKFEEQPPDTSKPPPQTLRESRSPELLAWAELDVSTSAGVD